VEREEVPVHVIFLKNYACCHEVEIKMPVQGWELYGHNIEKTSTWQA